MNKLLRDYPLMVAPIDVLMHWYWWTGLKTYILTPQVVFHGDVEQAHHSYASESQLSKENKNLSCFVESKKENKFKREIRRLCSNSFSKTVPQRIAFRNRVHEEINR